MKTGQTKMDIGQVVVMFLPIIIPFFASQHGLHGLILMIMGESAINTDFLIEMDGYRKVVIILTLTSILWSIYNLLKEPSTPKKLIVMTIISSVISIVFVLATLLKTGW